MRIAKPTHRKGLKTFQFSKRIPEDVLPRAVGALLPFSVGTKDILFKVRPSTQIIRFSLRTRDEREAKVRQASAMDFVERWLAGLRAGRPIELSHRQIIALAGEFYRGASSSTPDNTRAKGWLEVKPGAPSHDVHLEAEEEAELLTKVSDLVAGNRPDWLEPHRDPSLDAGSYMLQVDLLLVRFGVPSITADSKQRLYSEVRRMKGLALKRSAQYALRDYSTDALLPTLPAWEANPKQPTQPSVSLQGLLASWWSEASGAGISENTYGSYKAAVGRLGAFLKHDDAGRVSPDDMRRYRDHRLNTVNPVTKKRLSPASFRKPELAGLKTVFAWGVEKGLLLVNPAADIVVKVGKRIKVRDKDFTLEETRLILKETFLWRKANPANYWMPWLCAYSGARVGEIAQLRKQDIREVETGKWVMLITPDAGTVKSKEKREVPVHEHLIELGFLDYAKKAKGAYIFLALKEGESVGRAINRRTERLRSRVRTVLKDPNVAPNHGWRHTFKTRGIDVDIQEKVLDALCGHTPSTEGGKYGKVSLKAKLSAMAKFPRYEV